MEITKTIQNKNKILHNGYAHVFKKNLAQGWISYECERRRRYRDCSGKIRVKDCDIQVVSGHSHAPDPAKNIKYKVMILEMLCKVYSTQLLLNFHYLERCVRM